jgi:hypothetical protein
VVERLTLKARLRAGPRHEQEPAHSENRTRNYVSGYRPPTLPLAGGCSVEESGFERRSEGGDVGVGFEQLFPGFFT